MSAIAAMAACACPARYAAVAQVAHWNAAVLVLVHT